MKKTVRTYKVVRKQETTKTEQKKKESVQMSQYVSYYDLFKSLTK